MLRKPTLSTLLSQLYVAFTIQKRMWDGRQADTVVRELECAWRWNALPGHR